MNSKIKPTIPERKELEKYFPYITKYTHEQDIVKVGVLDLQSTDETDSATKSIEICFFHDDINLKTIMIPIKENKIMSINTYLQSEFTKIAKKLGDINRENALKTKDEDSLFDIDISQIQTEKNLNILKLKLACISNFIAVNGRIGTADFLIANEANHLVLLDNEPSSLNSVIDKEIDDDVIIMGRRSDGSNPGVILILNENSLSNIVYNEQNEECVNLTYAFALLGFHPEKQFFTINIKK